MRAYQQVHVVRHDNETVQLVAGEYVLALTNSIYNSVCNFRLAKVEGSTSR